MSLAAKHQKLYTLLLIYYWSLLFFQRQELGVERFSVMYFALIVPLLLYITVSSWFALFGKYRAYTISVLVYGVLVSVVAAARSDWATLYNTAIFVLPVIIVLHAGASISLTLMNRLFLLSILGSVLTYYAGNNVYGFLPGQAVSSADQGLDWRVSLFPTLPESAFFSLVALLMNWHYNPSATRFFFYAAALYFIVLSGLRTGMIALAFIAFAGLVTAFIPFRGNRFYQLFFVGSLAAFALLLNAEILLVGLRTNSDLLNNYLFRAQADATSAEELAQTIYRSWLWAQHLGVFQQQPWFGIGTFALDDIVKVPLIEGHLGTGSESFVTGLLARVGLMALPLFFFCHQLYSRAITLGHKFRYAFILGWGIFALGYASFMVPYNFIFLLGLAVLNVPPARGEPTDAVVAPPAVGVPTT